MLKNVCNEYKTKWIKIMNKIIYHITVDSFFPLLFQVKYKITNIDCILMLYMYISFFGKIS